MASSGTPGPGYAVTPSDTTGAGGNPGPASGGTQYKASTTDTSNTGGGSRATEPTAPPVTQVDTTGTNSANTAFAPTSTSMKSSVDTLGGGTPGQVARAYRDPSGPVAASTRDTTRTDVETYSGGPSVLSSQTVSGALDTSSIGAAGSGTGVSVPVAPAKPTAVSGPRKVTVSFAAVANPANDPVLEYVVENSRGGRDFAPKGATSLEITTLDPSYQYAFRVAARNKAGLGPFSVYSDPVRPFNPDAADVLKPGGLDPANVVNPVYAMDGSIKGGTGGTNNAPVLGAVTPGAAASKTVTVNWTAPTVGGAPTGYTIKASDGSTFTAAAGATSKACVFAAAGASVTFTVQATNAIGAGAVSAPSAAVTVP